MCNATTGTSRSLRRLGVAICLATASVVHAQDFDVPWAVLTSGSDIALDGGPFVQD